MLKKIIIPALFLFVSTAFILAGCSKSDDQKEFEQEAMRPPQNITETDASGEIIDNERDPDDWRISPMYQSLITIGQPYTQLPHPNPVLYNQNLTLEIRIGSVETLSSIKVLAVDSLGQNTTGPPIAERNNLSSSFSLNIPLSGQLISGSSGGSQTTNLYRIFIYDGRNNLISYGDVRVQ